MLRYLLCVSRYAAAWRDDLRSKHRWLNYLRIDTKDQGSNLIHEHRRKYPLFQAEQGFPVEAIPSIQGMLRNVLIQTFGQQQDATQGVVSVSWFFDEPKRL